MHELLYIERQDCQGIGQRTSPLTKVPKKLDLQLLKTGIYVQRAAHLTSGDLAQL